MKTQDKPQPIAGQLITPNFQIMTLWMSDINKPLGIEYSMFKLGAKIEIIKAIDRFSDYITKQRIVSVTNSVAIGIVPTMMQHNSIQYISRFLSHKYKLPVARLRKNRHSFDYQGLRRSDRRASIKGIFSLAAGEASRSISCRRFKRFPAPIFPSSVRLSRPRKHNDVKAQSRR